jgi:putative peptide zinc metalloprotease protein
LSDTVTTQVLRPAREVEEEREPQVSKRGRRAPHLAEGIELIGQYEGSGFKDPPYIARRSDGQMVQMAELLYFVAEEIDGSKTYDGIAERVTERFERGLDAEMVQTLVEEKLVPLGVVAPAEGEQQELKKIDPLLALKFRAGVVPERLVNAITTVFKPLFLPPVVVVVLGGLVALDVWLFGYHGVAQSVRSTLYDPLFILLLLGLVVLSAAFHECGHATACSYGGARPGVMGVGLYLVWPAFYTDVTDAYRLGKKGRLRTDLGGVYFNTIFILLTAGAYFLTGFEPLLLVIPLQHLEILHQFLPFIRLDGYYIVSDLTGVPDMFARIRPVLKSLLPWKETEDSVKELKTWARVAVTIYVALLIPALLFLLGMTVMNLPRVFATAYDSFVATAHKMGHAGGVSIAVDVIQLIVLVLMPLGLVLTFVQLGRRAAAGAWNATDGRPAGRALLLAATGAIAAFAAYGWIPRSVYKPISPTERGTLGGAIKEIKRIPSGNPPAAPSQTQNGSSTKTPGATPKQSPSSTTAPLSTTAPSSTITTGAAMQTTSTATTTTESTTSAASTGTTSTSTTDTTTTTTTPTTTPTATDTTTTPTTTTGP